MVAITFARRARAGFGNRLADYLDPKRYALGQVPGKRGQQRLDAVCRDNAADARHEDLRQTHLADIACSPYTVAFDMDFNDFATVENDGTGLANAALDDRLKHRGRRR